MLLEGTRQTAGVVPQGERQQTQGAPQKPIPSFCYAPTMRKLAAAVAISAFCLVPFALTSAAAGQAQPAQAPAPPPNLIQQVRAVINKGDLPGAEAVAAAYRED